MTPSTPSSTSDIPSGRRRSYTRLPSIPGISYVANSICSSSENAAPSQHNFCARQDGAATFGNFSVNRAGLSISFMPSPSTGSSARRTRRIVAPRAHEKSAVGIMLDFVLAHLGKEECLDSELSRRTFFARLGLKPDILVSAAQFGDLMPVTVRRTGDRQTVCFTFIDEGHRSTAKFERFLRTHDRLLCSLIDFAVIYVATTPRNFEHAQRLFERRFPATIVPQLPGSSFRSARGVSEQPRASFVTELITHPYPSALNPDPGYETGQDEQLRNSQTSLVSGEMPNDTG